MIDLVVEAFSYEFGWRALISSCLVGFMCGILGCFIVLRNMSLIGDALAHAVLPGVVIAFLLWGRSSLGIFVAATVVGLLTTFIISWVQQHTNTKNDAVIGIIFTMMFAIGIIGISTLQETGVHIDSQDFLFGNVLGVSDQDIYLTAMLALYTLIAVVVFYRHLFITTFQETIAKAIGINTKYVHYLLMLLLSFAIVSSLQTVGILLVVAMLVTPASTALLLSNRLKVVIALSAFLGVLSAFIGMILAITLNAPPGPVMTIVATIIYFLGLLFSPTKGLLLQYRQAQSEKKRILKEDVLKLVIKYDRVDGVSADWISDKLQVKLGRVNDAIYSLKNTNLIEIENKKLVLTDIGHKKAEKQLRAHRLWETYQVERMGLTEHQIHDEAEDLEHFLSQELLEEIDKELGYPERDPHNSPIPK